MREFSRILLFFSVFGLLLLVWYIFYFIFREARLSMLFTDQC